jgi:hypothetical protein
MICTELAASEAIGRAACEAVGSSDELEEPTHSLVNTRERRMRNPNWFSCGVNATSELCSDHQSVALVLIPVFTP